MTSAPAATGEGAALKRLEDGGRVQALARGEVLEVREHGCHLGAVRHPEPPLDGAKGQKKQRA